MYVGRINESNQLGFPFGPFHRPYNGRFWSSKVIGMGFIPINVGPYSGSLGFITKSTKVGSKIQSGILTNTVWNCRLRCLVEIDSGAQWRSYFD